MSEEPASLEVDSVSASYAHIQALYDVSMVIEANRLTAIVGANGAGKTTLLNVLNGTHVPDSGRVVYGGQDITRWPPTRRVERGLVLVPEGRGIIPAMSVEDNLRLGSDVANRSSRRKQFTKDFVYETFPVLADRAQGSAGLLSGGEQQMLAIGRSLLAQPTVLMLDEPSLGLSPKLTKDVLAMLARLRDGGLTVCLVEQNVRQAMKIADQYYLLETGKMVGSGAPREAESDEHIRAAYLGGT